MAGTITHEWNGTILTITSDSGTTAMDLKGEKGDTGARGARGLPGKSGGGARIEDGVISDETTWSSSGIIDRFAELMGTNANPAVLDNPYPNFPLQITTTFELKQSGSGEPYPAGGGKNLMNLTFAQSGLTIIQNADGTITATNNTGGNLSGARCEFTGILPAGTYTISKNNTRGDVFLQTSSEDYSNNITTYTFNYDGESYLRVLCGNVKAGESITYKIQLEKGSTATEYAPYANIRPIIGFDSINIVRCGKNLINPQIDTDNYYASYASTNADGSITVSNSSSSKVYPATIWTRLPSGTYTAKITRISGSNPTEVFLQCNDTADYSSNIAAIGVKTFTITEETQVRVMAIAEPSASYTASIQIEQGSTATEYEPYQGDTFTIALGGTYYGGTLDWNMGVLMVEWELISSYAGEALPDEWISDRDVYSTGATPTIGAQIAYKLETPTTIQLTPQEIKAIKGINTLYSNAQELTVIGRVDTMYQLSKLAERVAALESR